MEFVYKGYTFKIFEGHFTGSFLVNCTNDSSTFISLCSSKLDLSEYISKLLLFIDSL